MKTAINLIFMFALFGMIVVYPMYFYCLSVFGKSIARIHPRAWDDFLKKNSGNFIENSYKALNLSKNGTLEGTALSEPVMKCRKSAVFYLYLGAGLFMTVLMAGLFQSLVLGKY